jgi:DNA repair protein RadC
MGEGQMSEPRNDAGRHYPQIAEIDQKTDVPGDSIGKWQQFAPEIGDCLRELSASLGSLRIEQVYVLFLSERYGLLASETFGQGSDVAVMLDIRSVLRRATTIDARKIILVHNHPVGGPIPSSSDIIQTDRLANAARQVGVALVDHIIVSATGCISLMEARYASTIPPQPFQASIADYARITVRIEHRKNFLAADQRSALSGMGWILANILYFEERPTTIDDLSRLAGTAMTATVKWLMLLADTGLVSLTPSRLGTSTVFVELTAIGADLLDGLMSTAFWSGSDRVTLRSSRYGLSA